MGLDYTDGCVNFRDVGAYINLILDKKVLPEQKIYRGGSIDYIKNRSEIENVKTIISLRNREDFHEFKMTYLHFPMANKVEKYDTSQREVKTWLNTILKTFENAELDYPILIHCLSGKDRTGIVIAALLLVLGIDKETIIQEYLLSEGEVQREWIVLALEGMQDVTAYFKSSSVHKIKSNVLNKIIDEK